MAQPVSGFELTVADAPASAGLASRVRGIVVRLSLQRTWAFELRLAGPPGGDEPAPGDGITIHLGPAGARVPVFEGQVTALQVEVDEDGTSTTVRGLDSRHASFRTRTPTALDDDGHRIRYGLPDGRYERRMATGKGQVPGPDGWQDSPQGRSLPTVSWQRSLIAFGARLDHRAPASEVLVRGWDELNREAITATAGPGDEWPGAGGAPPSVFGRTRTLLAEGVRSEQEAAARAKAVFADMAEGWMRGTLRTRGMPGALPGDLLPLRGIGAPFDGPWRLHEVVHLWNPTGYETRLEAARTGRSS